jgi:hypothetical protein
VSIEWSPDATVPLLMSDRGAASTAEERISPVRRVRSVPVCPSLCVRGDQRCRPGAPLVSSSTLRLRFWLRMRRTGLLVFAIGLVGCFAAPTPIGPVFSSIDPPWAGRALSRDGSDTYSLAGSATVSAAASNSGGNTRTVWWDDSQNVLTDEQSCASWVSETNAINQQGAALRVTNDRAITVTKNIYLYGAWIFNVHLWDSSGGTKIGSFDLASVFRPEGNNVVTLPWNLCARVTGGTLTFVAWVDGEAQPTWGDASHGGTVTLPGGWVYPGWAGFYIGHLLPADQAVLSKLAAGPISNTPMPTGAVTPRRWARPLDLGRSTHRTIRRRENERSRDCVPERRSPGPGVSAHLDRCGSHALRRNVIAQGWTAPGLMETPWLCDEPDGRVGLSVHDDDARHRVCGATSSRNADEIATQGHTRVRLHGHAACLALASRHAASNSTGGTSPIGSRIRSLFHQCTQDRVASSTSSTVRHGPSRVMHSFL